jgi:hypothetical protein
MTFTKALVSRLVGALAAIALILTWPTASSAAPPSASLTSGYWGCSVPAGSTFDATLSQYNVCAPGYYATTFHLR